MLKRPTKSIFLGTHEQTSALLSWLWAAAPRAVVVPLLGWYWGHWEQMGLGGACVTSSPSGSNWPLVLKKRKRKSKNKPEKKASRRAFIVKKRLFKCPFPLPSLSTPLPTGRWVWDEAEFENSQLKFEGCPPAQGEAQAPAGVW